MSEQTWQALQRALKEHLIDERQLSNEDTITAPRMYSVNEYGENKIVIEVHVNASN